LLLLLPAAAAAGPHCLVVTGLPQLLLQPRAQLLQQQHR
jgi:hypothetical protein